MCFSDKYALFVFQKPFFPKNKPRRARRRPSTRGLEASNHLVWRHPITVRSLVVWSMARTQNFVHLLNIFSHFLKLFGIICDVSGGSLEVVMSNFRRKYFIYFCLSEKCLGGSRMVLGVPRTP